MKKAIVRKTVIATKHPFCTSVDRSRILLGRDFDEGIALASLWRFPVRVLI